MYRPVRKTVDVWLAPSCRVTGLARGLLLQRASYLVPTVADAGGEIDRGF